MSPHGERSLSFLRLELISKLSLMLNLHAERSFLCLLRLDLLSKLPLLLNQSSKRAPLHDLSVLQVENLVRLLQLFQSVSDLNQSFPSAATSILLNVLHCLHQVPGNLVVQRGSGLIQQEDWRVFQKSASESHTLLLASRELRTCFTTPLVQCTEFGFVDAGPRGRLVPGCKSVCGLALLREIGQVELCLAARPDDVRITTSHPPIIHVFPQAAIEELGILSDYRKCYPEALLCDTSDVLSIDQNLSRAWRVEAEDQSEQCRLAAPRGADETSSFTRKNGERDIVQNEVLITVGCLC
mmetsp:Transcript_44786/g.118784  ORF Transcript_44786/g.118784 Transcript_44786/m.118784 type:complete len:297 (+) Transcript_44786:3-893(+)